MRFIVAAAGLTALSLLTALPAAAQPTKSEIQSTAPDWCGFVDKMGSRVRCGYTSVSECKDRIDDKAAICMPNPSFAENNRRWLAG